MKCKSCIRSCRSFPSKLFGTLWPTYEESAISSPDRVMVKTDVKRSRGHAQAAQATKQTETSRDNKRQRKPMISYDTSEDTCSPCSLLRNSNLNRLENYVKDALQWFAAPKYANSSVGGSDRGEGDKRTRVDEDQATTNPEAQRSKTVKEAKETRRWQ